MPTFAQNKTGITLVALVVTIIVLLILAGISLNLIGGSNGILSRAQKAASTMELAKLKESKELADAAILIDMYAEGETYKTLYDYIKDKCEQNGADGGDKILETGNGSYWLDDDGNLHYKDKDTGSDAKVVQDSQGNPSIKEVTDNKGNVQDMTTSESLTSEIEAAIKDLIKEWQESGSNKTFAEFIQEKCEESGKDYIETANGGKLFPGEDGKLIYNDTTGNSTEIIVTGDGKVIVKEMTTPDGEIKDMTTESSIKKEIDQSISDLRQEWKESGSDKDFDEWLEEKCEQNGGSISTSTGGIIAPNGDGTFTYEDGTTPPNSGDFSVDENGKVKVENVELNKPDNGGNSSNTEKDESSIKSEVDKAMEDLKKEWQESGSDLPFDEWLKDKCENNGGKIPTSTGGQITSNGDGSFSYEDGLTPPNKADVNVDKDGKVDVENVQINNPGTTGTALPVKDLTIADITFDKKIAGTDQWEADWINQNVVVTAVPNADLTGYTLQTSKNNVTWKNVDNQTFTANGTFYVRAFNGKRFGKAIQTEITNIDKKAPEIAVETTTNSYSITMMDDISKIAGYKITETADQPEVFDTVDLKETFTTTGEGTPGKSYYAWAKDKAGNVTSKEFTLKEIPAVSNKDFDYTYEPAGWTNQDVLVTAEFKAGVNYADYTIQTSKDGANWESDNAQNFAENGKMFVRLADAKGNAGRTTAEATVDKIDKVDPTIDTVTATTKSYQFEASDEGSGLAGYQITADEEEPTTFETIISGAKTFTSPIMENQRNNRPYYIWLKDVAGNVIYKKVDLKAVDSATSTNISVKSTTWSGTSATVTFETTSTYQMQICTKASKNDEDWENKSVVTVESGTPIYVRLWDGVNGGNYYTHKPVITYQVQYNANGGTGSMANSTHEYGTAKALTANAFSKTGYTFGGWATSAGGAKAYDNSQSVTNLSSTNGATVNLYAVWTANTYTIAYNGNGATGGSTASSTHTYDVAKNLTANGFTKTGYTFQGWATSASGAVAYTNSQSVSNLTTTNGGTVTLYAVWKDTTAPSTPSISNPTGGNRTTGSFSLTLSSSDAGSGIAYYQYSYDQATWNTYANSASNSFVTPAFSQEKNQNVYIRCVDNAGNVSGVASTKIYIAGIVGADYGTSVNYSANGCSNWKVFSKDGNNIYLIAGDWVTGSTLTLTGTIKVNGNYVYTTDNSNTTLVNWMNTTSNWSKFVNTTYADQATGGPTLAQLATSANGKLGTSYDANTIQRKTLNDALYKASDYYWWLASPFSGNTIYAWYVGNYGNVNNLRVAGASNCGVRPLVRLKSGVKMTWDGSKWNLST